MSTAARRPLSRAMEAQIARLFRERLARPVSIDVWTREESGLVVPDRDPGTHAAEALELFRQLVRLHPALSLTPYDLDRHAARAVEAEVELSPTVVLRGGGRSVPIAGLSTGHLFPAMLECLCYLSSGITPLDDASRETLAGLTRRVHVELAVAPYDPYSAHMLRLGVALAVQSRFVRLRVIEASQFPLAAQRRSVTDVPALTIEGRRFVGAWEDTPLAEQLRRIAVGDDEPVIRDHAYTTPFITEARAREMAAKQQPPQQPPAPTSGGLYVPGRDA
ncbi:MAG: hypothetical protein WD734_01530 [Dehalococcoidia bacterium]